MIVSHSYEKLAAFTRKRNALQKQLDSWFTDLNDILTDLTLERDQKNDKWKICSILVSYADQGKAGRTVSKEKDRKDLLYDTEGSLKSFFMFLK